ncbi:MAG: NirD/YgiW/YdeI family stress tolerance protein [Campylobacter sp.]|nr:NirD/YgiW/YdeI family stress tolerance protein [Campylobacter sp.]
MKKIFLSLAVASSMIFAAGGFNGPSSQGGFNGPGNVTTVKEALSAKDDTKVILVGNITKSLGDENYEFKDATGTIVVEIDDDDWRGQNVGVNDTVRIIGEVDSELIGSNKIDVDSITKE